MTLASGAVMMVGGFLFHDHGWGVAGPVMIPAGPLITIAFALATPAPARRRSSSGAARVALAFLLPTPAGDIPLSTSLLVSAITLMAGAVMAVAGYAIAAWSLLLVPPIILAGGLVISVAFAMAAAGQRKI